ncbi:MAG: cytochrome C [Desulfuromonadales bacterium]|jgi:cytochrome c peroxidase|nr:cytochrome C [Desulfuromonadales bacterium]
MNKLIFLIGLLFMTGLHAHAIEAPSLSLGKTLFDSAELGTKGRSCSTCHPQGKGLDKVGDFNDTELKDIINACLRDALGAQTISPESQEMNALVGYVREFQKTVQ